MRKRRLGKETKFVVINIHGVVIDSLTTYHNPSVYKKDYGTVKVVPVDKADEVIARLKNKKKKSKKK